MKFRDNPASGGRNLLRRLRKTDTPPCADSGATALDAGRSDLALRLDGKGHIQALGATLARRLGPTAAAGLHLGSLVVQMFDWLDKPTGLWPTTIPIMTLRTDNGLSLCCAGFLQGEGDTWLLTLADISAPMSRLELYESKAQIMRKTALFAARLRAADGDGQHVVEDWLEQLSLWLKIPWAAVLVEEGDDWRLFAIFEKPGVTASIPPVRDIHFGAASLAPDGPLQCQGIGGETLWVVPYSESGRVAGWFFCGDFRAVESHFWLKEEEWSYLFAMIAGPVLRHVQRGQFAIAAARQAAMERLLCGGWWEYHPHRSRVILSPSLAACLGVEGDGAGGLAADAWFALVDPLDRDDFQLKLDGAHSDNLVQSLRFRVGGISRWYRLESVAAATAEGPCIRGFALDITSVKTREEEAAWASARLQGLLDSAPGIIYVKQYQDGSLRQSFCSASVEFLLGWKMNTFLERPYAAFIHPDDREDYFSHTRTLLQTGRSSCQYRMIDSDEKYHWMQDEALLLRNDRGMPTEAIGLCLDISDYKTAAERVIVSEERYRALVEDSPAIICRYDANLQLTFANAMLATSLGLSPDDLPLPSLEPFLSADERDKAQRRFAVMTPQAPMVTSEIPIRRQDGLYRWWVISERGRFDERGDLVEIQAVARDNTEVHETRQQLFQSAKMATLGEMATGLAHEINQPLNVMHMTISNLLTRLMEGEVPQNYLASKLERIDDQIQRTAGIVDHMRVFGRQSDWEGTPFNPDHSLAGALVLVEDKLNKDQVELHIDRSALPDVNGHPDRLAQVLINLILNAAYATLERRRKEPGHRSRVAVKSSVTADTVVICVEDNGAGINPTIIDRIFEPFFTTKPVGEGTGLGLSVSYAIIRQMSGRLSASNNAVGAVFTLELPIAGGGAGAAAKPR